MKFKEKFDMYLKQELDLSTSPEEIAALMKMQRFFEDNFKEDNTSMKVKFNKGKTAFDTFGLTRQRWDEIRDLTASGTLAVALGGSILDGIEMLSSGAKNPNELALICISLNIGLNLRKDAGTEELFEKGRATVEDIKKYVDKHEM